jgi:protein-S-isoprenylcysteine O-methyltransferase Ste14
MAIADASRGRARAFISHPDSGAIRGSLGLLYSLAGFVGAWAFFAALVVFLCNAPDRDAPWLGRSVDVGEAWPLPIAVLVNLGLVALFGLQHSLMARPALKRYWTHLVPPGLERATYVHAANAAGFAIILLWQPIPATLWDVDWEPAQTLLWVLFGLGWLLLIFAALSFDVLELLGVRQAWARYRGRPVPAPGLKTGALYAYVPHPMYVGLLLGVWATPDMSVGHALLAAGFTAYILTALGYEERDLAARFGSAYRTWRSACPMTIGNARPWINRRRTVAACAGGDSRQASSRTRP